jgi:hypothetical protein
VIAFVTPGLAQSCACSPTSIWISIRVSRVACLIITERAASWSPNVPVADHKAPPLNDAELDHVWKAFRDLPKPVLAHCSAGVDRTGAAIKNIKVKLKAENARAA